MLALVGSFVGILPYYVFSSFAQYANMSPAPTVVGMLSVHDPIEYVRQQEALHKNQQPLSTHFYELVRANLQNPYQEPFELGVATERTALLTSQNTPDIYKSTSVAANQHDLLIEIS